MMSLQRIFSLCRRLQRQQPPFSSHYISRCLRVFSERTPAPMASLARAVSTCETAKPAVQKEDSLLRRIIYKVPFINVEKSRLTALSYLIYEAVADKIDYVDFFIKCDLPDTFYSWFVITELHVWMLSVRAMAEGSNGRFVRNGMVEALWGDVGQRVKELGAGNPAGMRARINELSEQLQAALIAYDEGLLTSDAVLASALWRRIYQQQEACPEHLDLLVRYVRKQISYLDSLSKEEFLNNENIKWDSISSLV